MGLDSFILIGRAAWANGVRLFYPYRAGCGAKGRNVINFQRRITNG
ncbi:hypothetical protein X929_06115 [Petrotoga olearia DSM 13574]|uniref:Uncharacterized protein n=1 Tax=Petrotoga olearia DSM 13574 TaxID=1122955 RepID=A0A2K1P070_9BACT|nr:hypothetical protein X929_06115 [Petrotoga olearia DSM 13574]